MGRLTLNVLLSFAQFEREVTSERIRDKISASKRKGLWVGGMTPLGYDAKDRKITVNATEADRVRTIFRSYLKLGSLNLLMADLRERGIVTKLRKLKTGGCGGIELLGDRNKRHIVPVEQLDELGKIGQGAGQAVYLVNDYDVDFSRSYVL